MYQEIILRRTSVRSFKKGGIPSSARKTLEEFLKTQTMGPFGNPVRLELLDVDAAAGESLKQYGTYGLIKGVETYIAGCVVSGPGDAEDYGYCMEKAILEATRLGLGTVWLGGFLNRSKFGLKLAIRENEVIPAVSPVGVPADKRSFSDRLIRGFASSAKRKPFEDLFFMGSTLVPLAESAASELVDILRAVQWAPSATNKQPWRLVLDGAATHFYCDEDKLYNSRFVGVRIQGVDLGIAMAHYELMRLDFGQTGAWEIRPPEFPTSWNYVISWRESGG
jgi:nitroreductase